MNEIIFRFTEEQKLMYWLKYTINFLKNEEIKIKSNIIEKYIIIGDLKIWFKTDRNEYMIGTYNLNQYWVEDLFDNNFECFFKEILRENIYGKKRNQSI